MKGKIYLVITFSILFYSKAIGQHANNIVVKPYNNIEGTSVQANCKNEGDANIIFFSRLEGVTFEGEINEQRYNSEKNKYILCVDPSVAITIKITYQNNPPVTKVIKKLSPGEVIYFTIETEKPVIESVSKGEFSINSDPSGADIHIEGIPSFHEVTPFTFKGYTARAYKLFLEKENYQKSTVEIAIDEKKSGNKSVNLIPKSGFLSISADNFDAEGANVFLNDEDYGAIPLIKKQLIQGAYTIKVEKKGYSTYQQHIEITENQETNIPIKLSPIKEVNISSNVKKSEIYLDEKYIGKTPLTYDVSIGYHTIQIRKEGYLPTSEYIDFSENSLNTRDVNVTLIKAYKNHIKGKPSNAVLSALLPGLGDIYVNKYYRNSNYHARSKRIRLWWVIPTTYYLCAFGAVDQYISYKSSYASYHNAVTQSDMNTFYDAANTQYQNAQLYLGVAATMWALDILHVAVRGNKNKQRQLNRLSSIEQNTHFYCLPVNKNCQFGLVYKF